MSRRNPLALAVLSCLLERPMHPYEIATTLRSRGKELSIKLNYGSLYTVVESLQKRGMVSPCETSRDGRRPERTVYEITEAGRLEHEDWLAQLLSTPVCEFTSLESGLSLMPGLAPDEVAALLEQRVESLRMELRALDATHDVASEAEIPELFLIEGRYRRAMLAMEMDFVAELAKGIRSGSLGGVKAWRRMYELSPKGSPPNRSEATRSAISGRRHAFCCRPPNGRDIPGPVRQHRARA
jgi:DNA-binding PadR family transcriptional regulator